MRAGAHARQDLEHKERRDACAFVIAHVVSAISGGQTSPRDIFNRLTTPQTLHGGGAAGPPPERQAEKARLEAAKQAPNSPTAYAKLEEKAAKMFANRKARRELKELAEKQ